MPNYCSLNINVIVLQNTTKTIRLKAGALVGEGRVQVVRFAKWGAVCGNKWNSVSANVACRQMGFGTAKAFHTSTIFGRGKELYLKEKYTYSC